MHFSNDSMSQKHDFFVERLLIHILFVTESSHWELTDLPALSYANFCSIPQKNCGVADLRAFDIVCGSETTEGASNLRLFPITTETVETGSSMKSF
mmetsp:Transcript_17574/g.26910  ORF Transcript_17574/g.26910 Transcript_17574/m.26910 type:complete len:96 (-) Transcript_17574:848-1135(-)